MRYTRARDLVAVAIVAGVIVNLLLRTSYDSLPTFPALAGLTLLALAIVEFVLTLTLRPRLQGKRDTRPVPPVTAMRVVVLAKASALLGAIMFGAWGGVLGYVLPRSARVIAAAHDATSGGIGMGSAILLVGAALWLEYNCRTPHRPEHEDRHEP